MSTPPRIVVIGSINMDLVCRTPRRPAPGETILGSDLVTVPGGKGANQAVGVARLGAKVDMIGRVGSDDFGSRMLTSLTQQGVGTKHVTVTEAVASGCAIIMVDPTGENSIVVIPGSNAKVTPEDLDAAHDLIAAANAVVMQLEIPLDTVQYALDLCRKLGVRTILDPAPVPPDGLPAGLFKVDVLSPNQGECEQLLGLSHPGKAERKHRIDAKQMASDLIARGARTVSLKMGSHGAAVVDGSIMETIPGYKVNVVDTTAAGDAFTAGLAIALSEGKTLAQATRFANACGARCCETFGAQPAMPSRKAVESLLASH